MKARSSQETAKNEDRKEIRGPAINDNERWNELNDDNPKSILNWLFKMMQIVIRSLRKHHLRKSKAEKTEGLYMYNNFGTVYYQA